MQNGIHAKDVDARLKGQALQVLFVPVLSEFRDVRVSVWRSPKLNMLCHQPLGQCWSQNMKFFMSMIILSKSALLRDPQKNSCRVGIF